MPEEIAEGVKPEAIAKAMSESFRQQLVATGIGDTKAFLNEATRDLKRVTGELDATVRPFVSRYGELGSEIQNRVGALGTAAGQLQNAADAVDRKNRELMHENERLAWWIMPTLAVLVFLAGGMIGAVWEQRHATDAVSELQAQVYQLQQTVKALPAALAPPAAKREKKAR